MWWCGAHPFEKGQVYLTLHKNIDSLKMVYSNRYAYDSRRGQNPTQGIYGNYGYNPYGASIIEGYDAENSRSNISNYTLRVMPYDELKEDFIDLTQPSSVPIYLLFAIIVILFLLYLR
jgi:hypothetical protein